MARSVLFGKGDVTLRHEEFLALRDLVSAKIGVTFATGTRFAVERRLRERLNALGLSSFGDYIDYLRFSPMADSEWEEVVEQCTTNETYFFREDYQLRSFRSEVLPILAEQAKGRKRLSIWSAGCSTGEEVYSIAILILESGLFRDWEVRVYGSDVSRRCVAAARRAVYGPSAFRTTPPDLKRKYFVEHTDGHYVSERVREVCQFGQMNLLEHDKLSLVGRADAIFCRNVLIYFGPDARKRVIDTFHERLYPGGVLFLGHSESLLNVTTAFELLHLKEDLVYRKPRGVFRE